MGRVRLGVGSDLAGKELVLRCVSSNQMGPQDPHPRSAAVDFRALHYFVTVAEELHFGRAAERLFITQPALSQAIARLEAALDVRLLARTRHRVQLTPAGAELLSRGRRLLADKDETVERVQGVGKGDGAPGGPGT